MTIGSSTGNIESAMSRQDTTFRPGMLELAAPGFSGDLPCAEQPHPATLDVTRRKIATRGKIAGGRASRGGTRQEINVNAIRTVSCFFIAALGITLHAASAGATPVQVPCGTAINGYYTGGGDWLDVVGTDVTARGVFGFSAFTMAPTYNLATTPIGSASAANQRSFTAVKHSGYYEGQFHEVFPDRANPDVDLSDFWASTGGGFWLRSITWNGGWTALQGATCFAGPDGQTVIHGYIENPGFGTDYWTFVVRAEHL
jgi:hypothetical protein